MKEIDDHILQKMAAQLDRQNPEDDAELRKWLNQSPVNRALWMQYRKLWADSEKALLHQSIDVDGAWMKVRQNSFSKKRMGNVWAFAAVLVVLFSAGAFMWWRSLVVAPEPIEVFANQLIQTIELPDGSRVTLNRNAVLRYPARFGTGQREVSLEGEAYFEIVSDLDHKFEVKTAQAVVTVLGTKFNVDASIPGSAQVHVAEGRVAVARRLLPTQPVLLVKGECAHLQNDNWVKRPFFDDNLLSWKTRRMVFRNAPMGEVAKVLSRTYGVTVELGERLRNSDVLWTASFENQSLDQVLEVVRMSLPVGFRLQDSVTYRLEMMP